MQAQQLSQEFEHSLGERNISFFLSTDADAAVLAHFRGYALGSVFQPILELRENRLETVGFEAFIRPNLEGFPISPSHYFQSILPDEKAFVDRLCREVHLANFQHKASANEFISLNVDAKSVLEHAGEYTAMRASIDSFVQNGLPMDRVVAELDLAPGMESNVIFSVASHLRSQGMRIALSCFDADGSGLNHVVQNRPDIVKFNASWLEFSKGEEKFCELIRQTVESLRALGTKTHFEGIENEDDLRFALECGFDRFQGFHFARPSPDLQRPIIPA